ncbi:hypothetical protein QBC47DRAFT_416792 [Echria macrotheca]|uniref:Uncharacterized protein n=1 Tax=Echria macrotheca TaxID=438768 RepID=A0AAJ0B6A9_9PEZI|nr:hypothetical protein QBC47DRAFT_416792 [Echria macrotheca]
MAPLRTLISSLILSPLAAGLIQPFQSAGPTSETAVDLDKVSPPPAAAIPKPLILTPLKSHRQGNTKRDLHSALALKNSELLQWIGADGTLASFEILTPGANENVVNLERIDDLVTNITCPPPSSSSSSSSGANNGKLHIKFAKEADLNDASDVWEWVNLQDANHFMMVVGPGACGENEEGGRVLFNVTGVAYDDPTETAVLDVRRTSWKEGVHSYDLSVGKVDAATRRRMVRRTTRRSFFDSVKDAVGDVVDDVKDGVDTVMDGVDTVVDAVKDVPAKVVSAVNAAPTKIVAAAKEIPTKVAAAADDLLGGTSTPDFSVPFDHKIDSDKALSFSANGISVAARCKDCATTGSFDVRARFRAELFETKEAWLELATDGVTARAVVGLGVQGNLTDKLAERSLTVFQAALAGVSIPELLTIGPTVSVRLGVELSQISAGINMVLGGTANIPKSVSRLDFLSRGGSTATGWKPQFKADPVQADGMVEAKAVAFLRPAIGLEISVLDTGMVADISANTPSLTANLKAIASSNCTACGDSQAGLQGGLTLGASIGASLKKKVLGIESALFGITFAEAQLPLAGFCQGFGPKGSACLAA